MQSTLYCLCIGNVHPLTSYTNKFDFTCYRQRLHGNVRIQICILDYTNVFLGL